MENEKIFSTHDLGLASTLITLKFFMVGIDLQIEGSKNKPIGYFKFLDTPELRNAEQKYSQSLLYVEPKTFMSNLRSLKAKIDDINSNPHNAIDYRVKN